MSNRRGTKPSPLSEFINNHLPNDGCILIFSIEDVDIRNCTRRLGDVIEVHKINGQFINMTPVGGAANYYICCRGNLDDETLS